jgi:hypothetical protein
VPRQVPVASARIGPGRGGVNNDVSWIDRLPTRTLTSSGSNLNELGDSPGLSGICARAAAAHAPDTADWRLRPALALESVVRAD